MHGPVQQSSTPTLAVAQSVLGSLAVYPEGHMKLTLPQVTGMPTERVRERDKNRDPEESCKSVPQPRPKHAEAEGGERESRRWAEMYKVGERERAATRERE